MKCEDCGASLQSGSGDGLILECVACGKYPFDCNCNPRLGYTPDRIVHCLDCDEFDKERVDTSQSGWRSQDV